VKTERRSRRHVAKFILVGLYTGTRAGAICGGALQPTVGRGWIDVDRGVFYRRPPRQRETNKRQPPVPLPPQLLAHLRRWKRSGQRFIVEWNSKPVKAIEKAFANTVADAGLGPDVTPHVLRHTAATWLMQSGTNPWEAAGFLGMSVDMLLERCGHHHPDHLSGARKERAIGPLRCAPIKRHDRPRPRRCVLSRDGRRSFRSCSGHLSNGRCA